MNEPGAQTTTAHEEPRRTTLLDLLFDLQRADACSDVELVDRARGSIRSRAVVLTGNFRNAGTAWAA